MKHNHYINLPTGEFSGTDPTVLVANIGALSFISFKCTSTIVKPFRSFLVPGSSIAKTLNE